MVELTLRKPEVQNPTSYIVTAVFTRQPECYGWREGAHLRCQKDVLLHKNGSPQVSLNEPPSHTGYGLTIRPSLLSQPARTRALRHQSTARFQGLGGIYVFLVVHGLFHEVSFLLNIPVPSSCDLPKGLFKERYGRTIIKTFIE